MADGSFSGMRARGGIEVSATWENKKLKTATLKATNDNTFRLLLPDDAQIIFSRGRKAFNPVIYDGIAEFSMKKGDVVSIITLEN